MDLHAAPADPPPSRLGSAEADRTPKDLSSFWSNFFRSKPGPLKAALA
jgi:hypothetical protein